MSSLALVTGVPWSSYRQIGGELASRYGYRVKGQSGGVYSHSIGLMADELLKNLRLFDKVCITHDQLHTRENRKKLIDVAKTAKAHITCTVVRPNVSHAQINILNSMFDNHSRIIQLPDGSHSWPRLRELYEWRREYQPPCADEGIDAIRFIKSKTDTTGKHAAPKNNNQVYFFSLEGTLTTRVKYKAWINQTAKPTLLAGRREALRALGDKGCSLYVLSNKPGAAQSGQSYITNVLSEVLASLEAPIELNVCTHESDAGCYCRKPGLGMPINIIRGYELNPECITFVGDQQSDKILADQLGIKYIDQAEFFQ